MSLFSLFTFHFSLLFFSCQSDFYRIDGYARDFAEGDTICLVEDDGRQQMTTVENGKFGFAGHTDQVRFARTYVKHDPESQAEFFIEAGLIAVELHRYPEQSRVSGTRINNNWQQLADSVELLSKGIFHIMHHPAATAEDQARNARTVDSLHRRMSDCILHAAQRNRGNPLGRYIDENYKAPEFK